MEEDEPPKESKPDEESPSKNESCALEFAANKRRAALAAKMRAVVFIKGLWMKKKIGRFCQVATKLSTKNTK
jgi:hypothetical protein